jgi:hypothetical protein
VPRNQHACSTAVTPPPCRACPPNCLILRKIFSTLQGFSPRIRLFSIRAYGGTPPLYISP